MKRVIRELLVAPSSSSTVTDAGLLLVRLFAGLMLAFGHGLGKLPPSERFVSGVAGMGFPLPFLFAWAAALSEFLGGIFVAIGLLTRPAAFFIAMTMTTAAFIRHAPDPFSSKEKALLFLAIALCLVIAGAGRYSIDRLLVRRARSQ